ncbi:hypothetical protein E3N88_46299 [Mikania micrantha]|uniref:Uncharacterized protein n=1 Tax=Mikania micrantha TaxID=192012 RepID=A0A5N6L6Q9_9ASTR|nr:hypothetical protein E3N88_46299 [Mikania micrantha]
MSSVLDNPVVILNINDEDLPAETIVQRFLVRTIELVCHLWTSCFPRGTSAEEGLVPSGSVPDNPDVILDVNGEEMPGETNYTSFVTDVDRFLVRTLELVCRLWTHYFPQGTLGEESMIIPGSALNFVIVGLFSFIAIKSQGEARFPFHSNPQAVKVAITCLIVYGLISEAENVISAARPGPNSVYVFFIARLGRKLCLLVLVCAMASLFIL